MDAETKQSPVRVVTGNVAERRSKFVEDVGRVLGEELTKAGCAVKRHVVVKGDGAHIKQLLTNVSNDNEADVLVLIGNTGFGPHDHACEALDSMFEHRIEGFGEAYRRLLRNDAGVHAMLSRATAGVYNQCVAFAMSGTLDELRLAVEVLIAPTLPEAVALAYGRAPAPRVG